MTPDEYRYWSPGPRVRPFHYRWLLPALCGQNRRAWVVAQLASLYAFAVLLGVYTGKWWAPLLILGCAGVMFNIRHPVLVDLPAFALALGAAVLWQQHLWIPALIVVVVAGCVKETAAPFSAVWAWTPWLLVGLVPVALRHLMRSGGDVVPAGPAADALEHPIASSWAHHRPLPLWVWVLPWGVLLAAFANPSPQLWVGVALAYGQCLIATDTVRLYQWALPAMALAAVPMLSGPWLAVALLVHLSSPFKTDGL